MKVFLIWLTLLLACASSVAFAQTYPVRAVRVVVPFPPGGSPDILGRILVQKLSEAWGQQVFIDNRGGAAGNIGVEAVAKSKPDGYTLIMGNSGTFAVNPSLYTKLPFDPVKDFSPITLIAQVPNMLVVHPSLPVKSVKELVALAKSRPGEVNYGSAGVGSVPYMAVEYFKMLSGINIVAVPYRGTGPMMADLLGGHISMTINGVPGLLASVKAKQLRALAVGTEKRLEILPELPTIAEAGVRGYEMSVWYGILAPAGTPREIVTKVNEETVKTLMRADIVNQFTVQGAMPTSTTPEHFGDFIESEILRWAKVIKAAGAKVD